MSIRNHPYPIALVLLVLLVTACVTKPTPEPPAPTPQPTATSAPQPTVVGQLVARTSASPTPSNDPRVSWKSGKHASTFIVDAEGKNNDCARCHAPMNWMPTSIEDIPATCQTCKFTMKPPKPVVQADWKNIGCDQCHKTDKGVVNKQVAWLNAAVAQFDTNADPYEAVKSNTDLCEKCHRDAFKIERSKTVHATLACTDCHDAHSTAATCSNDKCHTNMLQFATPIEGHDAAHAQVECTACHDASNLKVGPTDDKSTWVAFKTFDISGTKKILPFVSHNVQRSVDCKRCHSAGNAWGLKVF